MIPGVVSGQRTAAAGGGGDEGTGAPVTDPNFASVVLLAVWDGLDSDSNFDDVSNSNHALNAFGDAQTDTDFLILSEPTLYLDGNGDYVEIADSDNWYLDGAFTIEFFARPDVSSVNSYGLVEQWNGSGGVGNFKIDYTYNSSTSKKFRATFSPSGSTTVGLITLTQANTNISHAVEHHICFERDTSDTMRLYVDGVMVASSAGASGAFNASLPLRIGTLNGSLITATQFWLSPVRITKGVARYANDSGFTPPTTPFPRS